MIQLYVQEMDGNVDLYNINKNKCICNAIPWQTCKAQHTFAQFDHDCVKGYIIILRYICIFLHNISACIHLLFIYEYKVQNLNTCSEGMALKCCV